MKEVLLAVFATLRAALRSRVALQLEVLALRHQLAVYQRCCTQARTKVADRLLWAWLSRVWVAKSASGWSRRAGVQTADLVPVRRSPSRDRILDRHAGLWVAMAAVQREIKVAGAAAYAATRQQ